MTSPLLIPHLIIMKFLYKSAKGLSKRHTKFQGHRYFGHWMCLIGLYLGTKYEVCRWNSLREMTSSLVFYHTHFGENLTLTFHRHLGHIGLYLGTKHEVCRWNSLRDVTSSLFFFYPFLEKCFTLTFDLDLGSRSLALRSLNAPYWVWSKSDP